MPREFRPNKYKPVTHGRVSTYVHNGCSCQPCLDAWTAYSKEYRARNAEQTRARGREAYRRRRAREAAERSEAEGR